MGFVLFLLNCNIFFFFYKIKIETTDHNKEKEPNLSQIISINQNKEMNQINNTLLMQDSLNSGAPTYSLETMWED